MNRMEGKKQQRRAVIIVAGGQGKRMGGDLPKQFIPLAGKPILMHTLERLHQWDPEAEFIVVLPQEQEAYWQMLCLELDCTTPHQVCYGGKSRYHSVKSGLTAITDADLIAVHDGVRPFFAPSVVEECFRAAVQFGAAIPVAPMVESVRLVEEEENRALNRSLLRVVQTPQVFQAHLLQNAYEQPYNPLFTDDASVVEAAGTSVHLIVGNYENIKITTPFDLEVAKALIHTNIK